MIVMLQRIVHPLIALGWAGAMLYFYGSGRIVKYLAPASGLSVSMVLSDWPWSACSCC